jgi:hypothetical protein
MRLTLRTLCRTALLCAVIVSSSALAPTAAGAQSARRSTWQYAYYIEQQIGATEFRSFNAKTTSPTIDGLATALGKTDAAGARITYVELFNAIGAEGWELVQIVDDRGSSGPKRTFYFKRQIP